MFLLPARLCHIWDKDLARDKKNPQIGARRHSREKIQGHTNKISPNRYKETWRNAIEQFAAHTDNTYLNTNSHILLW